ncbi:ABC transporter permease [Faecalicatena contorta]|uniref:Monosaccharide ABC transporter membrane protein, CUT2 family n=1 Tax=Faecalicatena contorta TaxID=39482 RepID=A0A315ZUR9_9FIRM|nr:ABC transporter permease [Faecalicatena contorta]PWJ48953.1 monosaccharide ABC transporter membrane protein (CUT2 family) [Faecalicatena contorta]SUQ15043.1 monosaccharide ABC transporter membrane protein, CUT2 family [Faecalicatena contorta]
MKKTVKKLFRQNETYIFLIILALSILIQVRSRQFYTSNNLVDILSAMVVPGLFAVGASLVILSGGIDVSFPALASLTAFATTKYLLGINFEGSVLVPILLALAIGAILGAVNGVFVSYFNLPAMIVTLGTASVFKGFMQGTLESKQLAVIPAGMRQFGTASLFTATNPQSGLSSRMPAAFLVFIFVLAITFFVLKYTMFGRGIYAIGGNEAAAYNAGYRVKRTKFLLYVFAGMIASVAGIIRVCMMQQCHPTNMLGMEMNIIAGVVLGGVAITGGKGTLTGCVLGTLLIVMVENSLILIGVPVVWKSVFLGALIVIGTAISAYQTGNSGGRQKQGKGGTV